MFSCRSNKGLDSHPPNEHIEPFTGRDFEHHHHHKHEDGPASAKEDNPQHNEGKLKNDDDYLKDYKKGLKEYYGEDKELEVEEPPVGA